MRSKVLLSVIAFLVCSTCFVSAKPIKGNGKIVTKQIPLSQYTEIEFGKGINHSNQSFTVLFFVPWNRSVTPVFNYTQQTGPASVEVTIDDNLFSYLDIEVSDGLLKVKTKNGQIIAPTKITVDGHSEKLESVKVSHGADFNIVSSLKGEKLEVHSSGGSDVNIQGPAQIDVCNFRLGGGGDLKADHLHCKEIIAIASGGSDIKLKGEADKANFQASGGSDIEAYDFIAKEVEFSASGGSDMNLHVTELLAGKASGGSDIRYYGSPRQEVSVSGGGSCKGK